VQIRYAKLAATQDHGARAAAGSVAGTGRDDRIERNAEGTPTPTHHPVCAGTHMNHVVRNGIIKEGWTITDDPYQCDGAAREIRRLEPNAF